MKKLLSIIISLTILLAVCCNTYAATPLIDNAFKITDQQGRPVPGGQVYTYEPGTTTPKVTYSDEAGTVPHPNPVPLDPEGKEMIYGNGAYTIDVKDLFGSQVNGWPKLVDSYAQSSKVSKPIGTIADLRTRTGYIGESVQVLDYYTLGGGGGGPIRIWKSGAGQIDDGGGIIVPGGTIGTISTVGAWVFDITKIYINIAYFGASSTIIESENRTILQRVIALLDGIGANIFIPADIDYGWLRNTRSTWPDFNGLTSSATRIIIDDYSLGDPETSGRSGAQFRKWYYTGNQEDGQHNGNFEYIKSGWHPGVFISNDGDRASMDAGAGINRRASVFFATDGDANWRIGQGLNTGDLPEKELSGFSIDANKLEDIGVTGLSTVYAISHADGRQGWNTQTPRYAFDFLSRTGQPGGSVFSFQVPDIEPSFILKGLTGFVRLDAKANSGFSISDVNSTLYDVAANGLSHTIRANTAGPINLVLKNTTAERTIQLSSTGVVNILNLAKTSNIVNIDDNFFTTSTTIRPSVDSVKDLGTVTNRFNNVYAIGTITPSDKRLKQQITDISDDECRAVLEMELIKFKFNSHVELEEKGGPTAEFHYGVIAQDASGILTKHNIDLIGFSPIYVTNTDSEDYPYDDIWQVNYTELQTIILEAIKRKLMGKL